ncbi:F-box-like protein [Rhizoctonia solani 123E]|uniref:F-box-like protein n=1 Tax=Rhizoctonia solani 123E TaxID=1423351 RepID=A0A074RS09_9AGAM|nr:F-box-like protein [Rhizoctonia solani 123E]
MAVVNLPVEIVSEIGTYLSNHALASASLVCKSWRLATLPILYYSIILGNNSRVERFSVSGCINSIQISPYVKKLAINLGGDGIDQSVLALLEPWVPRLTQLSELRWSLDYVPDNLQLVQLFQTKCSTISSVYVLFPEGRNFNSESVQIQFSLLLGFKNLVEFTLEIDEFAAGFEPNCARFLTSLLLNCPNLQSLALRFYDDDLQYSLDALVASLNHEVTLPHLQKLQITGTVELDERTLFSPPGEGPHPFRDFLSRHPRIKDLELGCLVLKSYNGEINPYYFSLALPSLKSFECLDHICDQVIRSTVASRLETLIIREGSFEKGVDFLPDKVFGIRSLPKLRKLEIGTNAFDDAFEIMKAILPGTEALEELRITTVPHHCYVSLFLSAIEYHLIHSIVH